MDQDQRNRIENALLRYRKAVLEHNLSLLRILIEEVEAQPAPTGYRDSAAQHLRVEAIREQVVVPDSIKSTSEILDERFRDALISEGCLDGVSHGAVDLAGRREYFAGVQANIARKGVEVSEFPPADLEFLCSLVRGVTGPGLPFHREVSQFHFVTPLEFEEMEEMMKSVCIPIRDETGEEEYNSLTSIWEDWEISIAFKIGGGPRSWGGTYALYCRNDDHEQWKWRYGVHDEEWYSDVYESVEDYLEFYTHFREQTEEELREDIPRLEAMRIAQRYWLAIGPMFSVFVNMVFHGVRYLIRSTLLPDHAVTPKEA
ncbi:hypothetical protein CEK26_000076 [Fusarium fujikuroi]|nr:hypothetical protein CEK27_000075 [Fusarium fujikuroi]QGI88861.1 hypothetical protein CEK26_000076 [Fusarium fujikuroi]